MRDHCYTMTTGISPSPEFEKKGLASFAVNIGTKCGHDCRYCSTGAMLRMHRSFKACGESPFGFGFSIADPQTPQRVAQDARSMAKRGLVQLCTIVDAWSPEAQRHRLGRRCLEAILAEPGWTVRVLTKNAAVQEDFDLIQQHRDRVLVGLSLTATPEKSKVMQVVEPKASSNAERLAVMQEAAALGLRTYGMLCPLLPGIADLPEQVDQLVRLATGFGAEQVFAEAVNPRGPGLRLCQEALEAHGFAAEAAAIAKIRRRQNWSRYVVDLVGSVQQAVRRHSEIARLRLLQYPSRLLPEHVDAIKKDDAGVVWLGKDGAGSGGA